MEKHAHRDTKQPQKTHVTAAKNSTCCPADILVKKIFFSLFFFHFSLNPHSTFT